MMDGGARILDCDYGFDSSRVRVVVVGAALGGFVADVGGKFVPARDDYGARADRLDSAGAGAFAPRHLPLRLIHRWRP